MKLKYEFIIQEVCGTYIAVSIGENRFPGVIKFNEIGKTIFEYISLGMEEDEIVNQMLSLYECTEEDMRSEVQTIMSNLVSQGIAQ